MFLQKRDSKDGRLSRDSSSNSISQQGIDKGRISTGIRDDGVYIRPSKSSNNGKQRRPLSAPVPAKNIINDSISKTKSIPNSLVIESKTSSKVTSKIPTDGVKRQSSLPIENKTPTTPSDETKQQFSKAVKKKTPTTPTGPTDLVISTTDV